AQRGGRGAGDLRDQRGDVPPAEPGAGPRLARGAGGQQHPRHQAQRGRAGPPGGAHRAARGVAAGAGGLGAGQHRPPSERGGVGEESAPSANDEYLFYQTLLGAWPMGEPGAEEIAAFRDRLQAYMLKAIREAKVHTSWTNPDPDYEDATARFVERTLDPDVSRTFLEQARRLKERLERPGQINAPGQTPLKLTSPGVPGPYQGTELWDLSLVDPDNRRPVDFPLRERLLS